MVDTNMGKKGILFLENFFCEKNLWLKGVFLQYKKYVAANFPFSLF